MALLFTDGFDWAGTSSDLDKKYQNYYSFATGSIVAGRNGGKAHSSTYSNFNWVAKKIDSNPSTIIVGVAIKPVTSFATTYWFLRLDNEIQGTIPHLAFVVNSSGGIVVKRGDYNGTTIGTSSNGALVVNTWKYIEVKATIHDTTGSVYIQSDGVNVLTVTNADTRNAGSEQVGAVFFGAGGCGNGGGIQDDIYIADTTGSYCNDFLGDCTIFTVAPSSDSSPTNFSTSSGSNHAALLDETSYDASDYVLSDTSTTRDQFNMGDLSRYPDTIHAAVVNSVTRLTDPGSLQLKQFIKSSGSENLSAALTPTIQTDTLQHPVYRDPNGTIAWARTAINSMEAGIEVA